MIEITNMSKRYRIRRGYFPVLNNINLTIHPGQKIGILGRNGTGKSTLIRLLSGAERPTRGSIRRTMRVSWPLAFSDAFQENQTGMDCIRFICRIYGIQKDVMQEKIDFIESFSELGLYLYEPIEAYSSGMRARLSFAISMAVDFDCFLIDEVVAVGDDRFHKKCFYELFEKRKDRAFVIVSHFPEYIKAHCDSAAVLRDGKLHFFEAVEQAVEFYQSANGYALTKQEVIAVYQFILGRAPESEQVIEEQLMGHDSLSKIRRVFFLSDEYEALQRKKQTPHHDDLTGFLSEADIVYGFKILLNRTPSPQEVDAVKQSHYSFLGLRHFLMNTQEFKYQLKRFCF